MRKLKAKQRRKQKGGSLVWVLIVMALTTTIITGLLYYVHTSALAHGKEIDRMEARYAADAGMEWFVAELLATDEVNTYSGDVGDDLWEEELGTVNGLTPTVRITEHIEGATSCVYIVESTAGGERVTARVLQSIVGGIAIVNVTSWEVS